MKKISALFVMALLLIFTSYNSAFAAHTITDHDDNRVELPDKIKRVAIVGILPFPAALTVFLGSPEKIIAIPPASMGAVKAGLLGELYPSLLKAKTSFNDSEINVEELLVMKPDIVFYTAGNKETGKILRNAGMCAVGISPVKWNYDAIRTYSEWVKIMSEIFPESAKHKEVIKYSRNALEEIQKKVKAIPQNQRKKVLFLFQYDDKKIVTSGKMFFGQYWCDSVGAINVSESVSAKNSNNIITMEQVYAWNPDVIFITNFTKAMPEDLFGNKIGGHRWNSITAVKNKAVYKMPLGTYRSYTPGVDTPITLKWIAQKVYPEFFKNVNIEKDTAEYYKKLYGITLSDKQIKKIFNQDKKSSEGFK